MNKFLWIILGMVLSLGAHAQSHAGMSAWVTLYETYQPAKITMENGKVIKQKKHQLGNAAWGASFPSERALPAGGFGSVHTPSP